MKEWFRDIKLSPANKNRLSVINSIIGEYQDQGYVLTLRQLYYQLVSRDVIPNVKTEYSKLSTLLKEGRMAGIVDWSAIEDRNRKISVPSSWESPEQILDAVSKQYARNRQEGQPNYIEVWVEKDALSGVLRRVTEPYHVPIMVNKGYSSASAMYDSYNRFKDASDSGQSVRVLYLGDFDPSGQDMIRDIEDRINEFFGDYHNHDFKVIPIALTMDQIKEYDPPPNPAKITDPRAKDYISKFGNSSWEVDALKPDVLNRLLTEEVEYLIDFGVYNSVVSQEDAERDELIRLSDHLK